MAANIELQASTTLTTTTKTETAVQAREIESETVGSSVDLGDNRACSVERFAGSVATHAPCHVAALIETSEDGAKWREVARFPQVAVDYGVTARDRVSFVADRFVRSRVRILRGTSPDKGGASVTISGRAVGAAE